MQTLYITHPDCHLHEMGQWHPESPHRLDAINDRLIASGLFSLLAAREAVPARDEDILRVHTPSLLEELRSKSPAQGYAEIDLDTLMNPFTLDAAYAAAGAGIVAVDAIMAGQAQTAFCSVRPPGHHAGLDRAMGFCFFNNLAITVAYTLKKYGLKRIAIIDFDVHHGNGTAEIFEGDERVLMCSFFQHPLFPNVYPEHPAANMLNVPVPPHADINLLHNIVESGWMPRLEAFAPEFIFVSAGFDGHREDELAQLDMVEADYAWITEKLVDLADRTAQGRIVSFLEGGYDPSALGRSVAAHIKALAKL
ncbi:MAG TPA: histone deacetylase family protein [Pusillimonas sp.]|uniref:histone deacetylase family protein n=1 Tax=Pusillimonas sp. TaxID=3040095 RepID=UPI002CDA9711|nr:histone deacetylase family protein [Pusillimonas sp.]HUH87912.1 histone deacetylase family protein [Pusillimonas sp.]